MIYTKNFTAEYWFEFQKNPGIVVVDIEPIYIDGEKFMHVTFMIVMA